MSEQLVRRVYKFRCYPTKAQAALLERQLGFACDLYNVALEQRRMLWREHGFSISHKQQSKELTELRRTAPELWPEGMARSAMQKTLERVNESRSTPSSRASGAANSPAFPAWNGVGEVKVRAHRPLPERARVTEVQIKRVARGREWYVCVGVELPAPAPLPTTGASIGIDLGITTFAALSNGEKISGPRSYRRHERRLAILHQELARCQPWSRRGRLKRAQLARVHARTVRVRRDHARKTARSLVERFDVLYIEDLNI
jgi:putative transposase